MINIRNINENEFEVTIDATTKTIHIVTIPEGYHDSLTSNKISKEELIRRSFEFLMERESNTMIFREFKLNIISRYFPEYESTIKDQIA